MYNRDLRRAAVIGVVFSYDASGSVKVRFRENQNRNVNNGRRFGSCRLCNQAVGRAILTGFFMADDTYPAGGDGGDAPLPPGCSGCDFGDLLPDFSGGDNEKAVLKFMRLIRDSRKFGL